MNINNMTKEEFEKLPHWEWNKEIVFDSMIILPVEINQLDVIKYQIRKLASKLFKLDPPEIWEIGGMHDSGYRCMDFVAIKDGEPICLLAGCSDVIHIDGIGGYGRDWLDKYSGVPDRVEITAWSIDCLAKSGLLRMFNRNHKMTCGPSTSSFEIFVMEKEDPVPPLPDPPEPSIEIKED